MVNALILVMYVTRHSVNGTVLKHINAHIVVNAVILVMCVIRYSVRKDIF